MTDPGNSAREYVEADLREPATILAATRRTLERFFDGLDLLEPGVVTCSRRHPESHEPEVHLSGGVGRIG